MKRFFQVLFVWVGIWVLVSFLGVMFDPVRKNLWTQSLMWAMLSCAILAPVFIFVGTGSSTTVENSPSSAERPFDQPPSSTVAEMEESSHEQGWPHTTEQEGGGSAGPSPV